MDCDTKPLADGNTPCAAVVCTWELRLIGVVLLSAAMWREVNGRLLKAAGGLTLLLQSVSVL